MYTRDDQKKHELRYGFYVGNIGVVLREQPKTREQYGDAKKKPRLIPGLSIAGFHKRDKEPAETQKVR